MPIPNISRIVNQALRRYISHPAIVLLGLTAWGLTLVSVRDQAIGFVLEILGLAFTAGFFGIVVELNTRTAPFRLKLIWTSIRKLTIGMVVIAMAITLPILILVPVVLGAVGLDLRGNTLVLLVAIGPTVVPSIAAMWSFALGSGGIVQAVLDGLDSLRGKWLTAFAVGLLYQALALAANHLLADFLVGDAVLSTAFGLLWAGIEAVFRLAVLEWLFEPDAHKT